MYICFEFLHLNVVEILMSADKLALHMIGTINSEIIQVSADKVGKKNQFDLVELAAQVQLASATSYFASPHNHCFFFCIEHLPDITILVARFKRLTSSRVPLREAS